MTNLHFGSPRRKYLRPSGNIYARRKDLGPGGIT